MAYQQLSDVVDEMIAYCFRPMNQFEKLNLELINDRDENFTFDQLNLANVTSEQLFSHFTMTNLSVEPDSSLSNKMCHNQTKPRYGVFERIFKDMEIMK